ncbi:MAG: hypothetical protein HZA14_12090 [Nitrospirae bacterium]|nr:hypothetical protein [Nitrospirota bacterium]
MGELSPRPAKQWLKLAHKIEDSLAGQYELLNNPDEETMKVLEKVRTRLRKDKGEISACKPLL